VPPTEHASLLPEAIFTFPHGRWNRKGRPFFTLQHKHFMLHTIPALMDRELLHAHCKDLLAAYQAGTLGQTHMPEDSNPGFSVSETELRLAYFTLPMALNYQRDSYKLWEAALHTYNDPETRIVFDVQAASKLSETELRRHLMKYKLALQPNKHVQTWHTLVRTLAQNWGSLQQLMHATNNDYLELRTTLQTLHKKEFPYLSGPKIFNYWSFIMSTYGGVPLRNREHIDIAPDTHITKCSVLLGVITEEEATCLTREDISERWREALHGTNIAPIDMHPPLWFWSRNGFVYRLSRA
jgi:hypothetical protein